MGSLLERLSSLPVEQRDALVESLEPPVRDALLRDWRFLARPEQLPPSGDWFIWFFVAGRGAGKTRSAAEFVVDRVSDHHVLRPEETHRIGLAGRASTDARDVIVEGESGLVAVAERRGVNIKYEPSKRRVSFPDLNATGTLFSSEEPDQARGPQYHTVWADEIAAWSDKTDSVGNNLWTNLVLGLRLGDNPRAVVTTTPKRVPIVRDLHERSLNSDSVVMTNASTLANASNLSQAFLEEVFSRYAGTRLAAQELEGLLLFDVEGALWDDAMISNAMLPRNSTPEYGKPIIAVDPSLSSHGDEYGLVVVAPMKIGPNNRSGAIVLDDVSGKGSPETWASRAIRTMMKWGAHIAVAESNQGGAMVRTVLKSAHNQLGEPITGMRVELVHASDGKSLRAQPVAQLYEQNRVRHAKHFDVLVDQMTSWTPEDNYSPDRLDALVHGITYLIPEINSPPASVASGTGSRIRRQQNTQMDALARLVQFRERARLL